MLHSKISTSLRVFTVLAISMSQSRVLPRQGTKLRETDRCGMMLVCARASAVIPVLLRYWPLTNCILEQDIARIGKTPGLRKGPTLRKADVTYAIT